MENFSTPNDLITPPQNLLKPKSWVGIFFLCFFLIFLLFFLFNFLFLKPPSSFPSESIEQIKAGATLRSVSQEFKSLHLIKSRIAFETLVMIYGNEKHIIPGDYFFEKKLNVIEVAKRIALGDKQLSPLKVTIPEGYNMSQIAEVFSMKLPHFNEEQFLIKAQNKEGYLFPDTYFFLTEATEDNVIESMSKNFEKKFMPFLPDIAKVGKNEKEIIVMASIIEREAKGDNDRAYISGILWNRVRIGMPLQVDAWPATYKTKGLPENPISNPGLEAIQAAIYPKMSSYLYYLHGVDGQIHFAKNFAEHKANKLRYLK